jgi:hypothetical protein
MNQEDSNETQMTEQSVQQSKEPVVAQPKPSDGSGLQVPPPKTDTEKRGI